MRFTFFKRRSQRDLELDDEIRAHFEMAVRDRMARGEARGDAEAAARREFGNVGHVKEVTREMWGGVWLERLRQDLRFAVRSLRRSPTFTIVASLTLALGIGVNTAMFAVLHGVLLRRLPFPEPEQLVVASYKPPRTSFAPNPGLTDANYVALERGNPIFANVSSYAIDNLTITGAGEPLRVRATLATPSFLPVLGVSPRIGRAFEDADATGAGGTVAIISDRLWRSRFERDARILGRSVVVEGVARTIVGVMPERFDFPAGADVWLPWRVETSPNQTRLIPALGRLGSGVTLANARRMFATYATNLPDTDGARRESLVAEVIPLETAMVGDVRTPLLIFSGAIGFVLLIACANVANLLLMRVASRDRELALRAALGAGRWRLVRQLLTETLVLTLAGAIGGIAVAWGALRMLLALAPPAMLPRADGIRIDPWTLAFAAGLALLTAIVCGAVPALHASEQRLRGSLAAGARSVVGGRQRLRSLLVGGEIALALVLLVGAGLLVRSFERMRSVDLGFDPRGTFAVTVDLPPTRYASAASMRDFQSRVLGNLGAIPGVDAAGAVNWRPLGGMLIAGDFTLDNGREFPSGYRVDKVSVSPGYFRAMGIRLERGRDFTADDRTNGARVVVLSHSVAEKFWPGGTALGKRIAMTDQPEPSDWMTIVGIVNDVVQDGVTSGPHAASYIPFAQTDSRFFLGHLTFVVRPRVDGETAPVALAATRIVREADPNLAIETATAMTDLIARTTAEPRFESRMLSSFSLAALALATIGVYGVLSYNLAQRRQEIGVRIALGAAPSAIVWMVLRRTAMLVVPSIAVGLVASAALTRVLGRFLFQITATDPATFAFVAAILAVVALSAAALPARRASRIDPSELTRSAG